MPTLQGHRKLQVSHKMCDVFARDIHIMEIRTFLDFSVPEIIFCDAFNSRSSACRDVRPAARPSYIAAVNGKMCSSYQTAGEMLADARSTSGVYCLNFPINHEDNS